MADVVKHKFQSTKPDGLDATLVRPSNWNEEHSFSGGSDGNLLMRDSSESDGASWVGGLTVSLTNRTGEQLVAGDVVAIDPDNDASVAYHDVQGSPRPFVVAQRTINDGAVGPFIKAGFAQAKVTGTVTRGNWLRKSATNAALEDTGVSSSLTPPGGSLAVALQNAAGPGTNLISVYLLGLVLRSAKSVYVFTTSGTLPIPIGQGFVKVTLVGGGGGGGGGGSGNESGDGGGGGAGGAAGETVKGILQVEDNETLTITIGVGGAGGPGGLGHAGGGAQNPAGNSGTGGNAGTATSVSGTHGTITAPGGAGGGAGVGGTTTGGQGAGGAAPSQHVTSLAFPATSGSGGGGADISTGGAGGRGGVSEWSRGVTDPASGGNGGTGGGGFFTPGAPGADAQSFGCGGGGGGGGGASTNNAGSGAGGAGGRGSNGLAIIEL